MLDPDPRGDDQPVRGDRQRVGHDNRPGAVEVDPAHRGGGHDLRLLSAMRAGQLELKGHRPGGGEHAGVGLEYDVMRCGDRKDRIDTIPISACHPAMRNAKRLEVGRDAGHVIETRWAERDATGADVDGLSGVGLQLFPCLEGRGHQSRVGRVRVGVPGNSRRTMRAAAIVTEGELLDQEHWLAPSSQTISGGRTDGPRTNDRVPGFDALHTIELDGSGAQAENMPEKPCCQLTRGSPGRLPLPGRQVVDPALAVLSGGRYLPAGAGPAAATEDSHAGWTARQMPDGGPWH